jgi:hypothetical protein
MALRLGIISTARIDEMILRAAELTDAVDVAAVASRDLDRAESFARTHGIRRAYGSYDELLSDPDLDAVYIALPNSMHGTGRCDRSRRASTCSARSRLRVIPARQSALWRVPREPDAC